MKPLLLLACCLALALPAAAATDPFSAFRIPEHSWWSGSASARSSATRNHQDAGGDSYRYNSMFSLLEGRLARGWDSDALQYGYGISLNGQLQTEHTLSDQGDVEYREERDYMAQYGTEYWRLDGSLRSYPWQMPLGLGISAVAVGNYGERWSREDDLLGLGIPEARRDEHRQTLTEHLYQTRLDVTFSAGFGRVRDASVVYDVHVLEQRLIETGALTRPLSAQARAKLAALYYVAPFYRTAHERPDRYVWRDVERLLREDGALRGDGLDAYSVLRAQESPAPAGRSARQRGWFVGAVGGTATRHYIGRSRTTRSCSGGRRSTTCPAAGAGSSMHRPG